jgi:release factor glutamine methyltransferase
MLLQNVWCWAIQELTAISATPYLDAELLLAMGIGFTREQVHSHALSMYLSACQQQTITTLVKRRKKGEPIAYLLGQQEFWSLSLAVSSAVLIPRPETELLVQQLLTSYTHEARKIADLGTGSGAIALALATERPAWQLIATDYSAHALQLAERNRNHHRIQNVALRFGDWCNAFLENEYFDAIVSNPPYLAAQDAHLQSEMSLAFEPKMALIAGENALQHLETIIHQARHHLLPGGYLFLEHGYNQALHVAQFFLKCGYHTLQSHKDLAGHQRVMIGKWH